MNDETSFEVDGRRFDLALTGGKAKRVQSRHGVDLLDVTGGQTFTYLSNNRGKLLDVLAELAAEDLERHGLDPEAFWDLLDSEAIEAAGGALVAAIVGFSPSHLREAILAVAEATDDAQAETAERLAQSVRSGPLRQRIGGEIDQAIANAEAGATLTRAPRRNAPAPTRSSTSSPRSAASIRTATP